MRSLRVTAILATVGLVVGGCGANFHSIFRTTPGDGSKIAWTDAKQAATIIQYKDGVMKACAAKSPDVFQALSTAFSGNLSVEEASQIAAKVAAAGSSSESAASFRLHTQLTDTQNELLYQLCVNSLNGTITPDQLATELHRYQNTMVTMLAIEQLTGYARPTVVSLGGGSASTGSAEAVAQLQASVEAARTNETKIGGLLDTATKNRDAKTAARDKAKGEYDKETDATKKAALKPAWDEAEKQLATAEGDVKTYTKGMADATKARQGAEAARDKALADATTNATGATPSVTQPASVGPGAENVQDIANAVEAMQKAHLTQTFTTDECLNYMFHPRPAPENENEIRKETDGAAVGKQKGTTPKASPAPMVGNATDGDPLKNFCMDHLKEVNKYKFQALYLSHSCDSEGKNCATPTVVVTPPAAGRPPKKPDGAGDIGVYVAPFKLNVNPPGL